MSISLKRLLRAFMVLNGIILLGVTGFMAIEGLSFVDALYMTVITMSTVGYETVGTLSTPGKLFVIFLIISTIGTFFYVATFLATFVVEGEMNQLFKTYRVNKEIQSLSDHIIICGLGRNGKEAARELLSEGIPFVVIEENQDIIDHFISQKKILVLQGDAREEEALINANVKKAKAIITTLPEDAANVFVTLTARELNAKAFIVSLASNESSISKLKTAGADRVVLPNLMGGKKMAKIITQPALTEFVDTITGEGDSDFELHYVNCGSHPSMIGKTLIELQIKKRTGVLVLGYKDSRGKIILDFSGEKVIKGHEILFILGTKNQMVLFREVFQD